jgi:PAS domain S-box-containing protein
MTARILLVDDIESNLVALEALLQGPSVSLVRARSGAEALRAVLEDDYALILLDVQMPDMDGFATAAAIRQQPKMKHVPIIFVTAYDSTDAQLLKAYSMGAADYLSKPIRPEILRAKVSVFTEAASAAEAARAQADVTHRRLRVEQEEAALAEQKRLQQALIDSERRFRTLAEATSDIVWTTDAEGRPTDTLPSWRAFTGQSSETIGAGHGWEAVHPDDVQQVKADWSQAVRERRPFSAEYRLRRHDGVFVPMAAQAIPVVEGGAIREWVGTLRDISATKRAESERALLLASETEARRQAEAAGRAKDEFLAMLGHELRNPLAPIRTALQLMRLRGETSAMPERAAIERQVAHLVRLVDDLLDVSRITRGRVTLEKRPIEVSEVIAKAIEMSRPLVEERKHNLTVSVPQQGLAVNADLDRLAQVFANLLTNAAKYTDPCGTIAVSARREMDRAVVSVRDNGNGIPADLLPHVFDLFSQGSQTLERSEGGLGIGLSIVRSLVAAHDGVVTAHSDGRGNGSEFIVSLPLVARAAEPAAPTPTNPISPAMPSPLRTGHILVVDDNRDVADLVTDALRFVGYSVDTAYDGPTGLEMATRRPPDVAVLDIGLPGMDGYELARRLRALPSLAGVYLIAITGYGEEAHRRRSSDAGFDQHMVKPVDLDRLQHVLDGVPNRKR